MKASVSSLAKSLIKVTQNCKHLNVFWTWPVIKEGCEGAGQFTVIL